MALKLQPVVKSIIRGTLKVKRCGFWQKKNIDIKTFYHKNALILNSYRWKLCYFLLFVIYIYWYFSALYIKSHKFIQAITLAKNIIA